MLVHCKHPVLYSYRPRRARSARRGFGTAVTPVELREVAERPREALRVGASRVFAAEGTAWTVLSQAGRNVTPEEMALFLSEPAPDWSLDVDVKAQWALCSPLYFHDAGGMGRTGTLDPTGAEGIEGGERAARDVRAFLADRVRLHGNRVLVREERLVGLMDLHQSQPRTLMGDWSRGRGTMLYRHPSLVAIRPDRLGDLWDLHERKRKGPVPKGPWNAIEGIPAELRRDDDIAWVANRLPGSLLPFARDIAKSRLDDPVPLALVNLIPALEVLERRAGTHAVAGGEVAPALETIREALSLSIRIQEAWPKMTKADGDSPQLQVHRFLLRSLDEEYLPRLHRQPGRERDEDALVGLAPR